ncbi:outer membrane beta-barrel protein [Gymnodinialimonas sp. 57CJ19]|uniref:outer membrane protein n=1 Tax=Gymnodinialimonas sp. 57CJ19 TaxID=3138498 RepID=UPI00313435E3
MLYHRIAVALGVAVATVSSVQAEDTHWSGFYAGGVIGYGSGAVEQTDTFAALENTVDIDGVVGGLFAGYNEQNGSTVYGIEVDALISGIEGTLPARSGRTCYGGLPDCHQSIQGLYSARARLGVDMGDLLLFVTAGIAGAEIVEDTGNSSTDIEGFEFGWVIGLGADYRVSDDFSLRADFLLMDFPSQVRDRGSAIGTNETETLGVLRIGGAFHF